MTVNTKKVKVTPAPKFRICTGWP